jgi:hypothetical protein
MTTLLVVMGFLSLCVVLGSLAEDDVDELARRDRERLP